MSNKLQTTAQTVNLLSRPVGLKQKTTRSPSWYDNGSEEDICDAQLKFWNCQMWCVHAMIWKRNPFFFFFQDSNSDVESVEPTKVSKKSSKKGSKKQANTKPSPTACPDESIPENALWDFTFYLEQETIFEGQYPWEWLLTVRICV